MSGLCLLHCLSLPLVISLIPSVTWMENELTHVAMAALALLLALNAVPAWPRGRAAMFSVPSRRSA